MLICCMCTELKTDGMENVGLWLDITTEEGGFEQSEKE